MLFRSAESSALIRFGGRSFVLANNARSSALLCHLRAASAITFAASFERFRDHDLGPRLENAKENNESRSQIT